MPDPAIVQSEPQKAVGEPKSPQNATLEFTKKSDSKALNASDSPRLKSDEIIRKVSESQKQKAQESSSQKEGVTLDQSEMGYNSSDIERIKDPEAKKIVESLYKSFQSGFNKKFMQVAEEKKSFEKERDELKSKLEWTPERVSQLLNDPKFVQSASYLQQSKAPQNWEGSQEEWSALNDNEKRTFSNLVTQVDSLMKDQATLKVQQYDQKIREKYPDYDPGEVEKFGKDFDDGKITTEQLREMIWLAIKAPQYIENSYNYAMTDKTGIMKEKLQGSTQLGGVSVNTQEDRPIKGENEKPQDWFRRLARFNLSKIKSQD